MAEKLKTPTLNIPTEVVDSEWRDDVDTDYATREDANPKDEFITYKKEGEEYIDPTKVSKESIEKIKSFREKIAFSSLNRFRKQQLEKAA